MKNRMFGAAGALAIALLAGPRLALRFRRPAELQQRHTEPG